MGKKKTVRFDEVFKSDVIEIPHIKIASNHYSNLKRTTLFETKDTSPFDRADQVVITYVLEGCVESSYTGLDKVFQNKDGKASFIYAPRDNEHLLAENQYIDSLAIGISKKFFQELLTSDNDPWIESLLNQMECKKPFSPTMDSYPISVGIKNLLSEIRSSDLQGGLKALYRQSKITELLLRQLQDIYRFQQQSISSRIPPRDLEKLYWVKEYLETNSLGNISLSKLSKDSGLNLFKLKKEFKELFGVTVFEQVRALRMRYALNVLTDTDTTVGEVAQILGYEHTQHFSTAFKKHFGKSPSHYMARKDYV